MHRALIVLLCASVALCSFIPQSQASLACITCVATVKGLEPKVLAEGEAIAKKDVDAVCLKEVPTKSAEHLCEEYGEHEVEVIVNLIKKDVPPKTICQQLGKC